MKLQQVTAASRAITGRYGNTTTATAIGKTEGVRKHWYRMSAIEVKQLETLVYQPPGSGLEGKRRL
jgi:hypothetical protein